MSLLKLSEIFFLRIPMTFDFRIESEISAKENLLWNIPYIHILYSKGDDDDNKEFVSSFIGDNLVSKNIKTFFSFFLFYFHSFFKGCFSFHSFPYPARKSFEDNFTVGNFSHIDDCTPVLLCLSLVNSLISFKMIAWLCFYFKLNW